MYLGLDLGTSGLRAVIMDGAGQVHAEAQSPFKAEHPRSGWSEQDPDLWIEACQNCFAQLAADHRDKMQAVLGISLSGHMHGAVLLDAADRPLRPCLLWNDTRAADEARRFDADPLFRAVSGNIVFPGFTAPKVAWVAQNEPDLFAKCATVMLPKDYLRLWLTGIRATDMSDAAGTSWLDVGARAWSEELVETTGLRLDQLPNLLEGAAPAGTLRPDVATAYQLRAGVVVVAGGADNAVAACGVGCFAEGDGFVSLGTSGVVLAAKDSFAPMPDTAVHSFCHAVPDRWYQMGVILAATDCMNWLSRNLGQSAAELSALVDGLPPEPTDLMFVPYLSGERTPHNDASIRGAFVGLDVGHGPADLTKAVMQGVSFALVDNLQALSATGTNLTRVLGIGGGTASAAWVQMLATSLGVPIQLPVKGDFGAAVGAARLAQLGTSGGDMASIMSKPAVAQTIDPDPAHAAGFAQAHQRYQTLYPALKELNP
ncbi:xylulokinase [Algirhabdus cladophorae]|uniref:xylulokinase n=1 Tax=Algirhabdus cladophorae TaxID=3377108 RepID=UPI003B849BCB